MIESMAIRRLLCISMLLVVPDIEAQLTATQSHMNEISHGDFWIDRYEYPNVVGQMPMVDVSWQQAQQLCQDRGQRLCTEAEWEQAAKGSDNFAYGYGPEFEAERCNTPWPDESGRWRRHRTSTSGAFGGCQTPAGVFDLIGNVWEWTDGWYDETAGWRPVRGGSWFQNVNFARSDGRYGRHLTPQYRLDLIGFRCCRSARPANTDRDLLKTD